MRPSVLLIHDVEGREFGQNDLEQARALQILETDTGVRGHHDLVQFVLDALAADNLDTIRHPLQRLESLILYLEVQLGGKADAAHHPQGIVAESYAWLQRRSDDAVLEVSQPIKRINEFAESAMVQADSHRIDREVATVLIVLQRAVLHDGLSGVVTITLLAGSNELHLILLAFLPELHLGRAEVPKDAQMGLAPHHTLQFLGQTDAAAHDHHVDIIGGALEEDVPHIAPYDVALKAQAISRLTDLPKHLLV